MDGREGIIDLSHLVIFSAGNLTISFSLHAPFFLFLVPPPPVKDQTSSQGFPSSSVQH